MPQELIREQQVTIGESITTNYHRTKVEFCRQDFIGYSIREFRKLTRAWANRELEPAGFQLRPTRGDVIHQMSAITNLYDKRDIQELLGSDDCYVRFNHQNQLWGDDVELEINMDRVRKLPIPKRDLLFRIIGVQTKRMLTASYKHRSNPNPTVHVTWKNPNPLDRVYVEGFIGGLKGDL